MKKLLIILLILLSGCSQKDELNKTIFNEEEYLVYQDVNLEYIGNTSLDINYLDRLLIQKSKEKFAPINSKISNNLVVTQKDLSDYNEVFILSKTFYSANGALKGVSLLLEVEEDYDIEKIKEIIKIYRKKTDVKIYALVFRRDINLDKQGKITHEIEMNKELEIKEVDYKIYNHISEELIENHFTIYTDVKEFISKYDDSFFINDYIEMIEDKVNYLELNLNKTNINELEIIKLKEEIENNFNNNRKFLNSEIIIKITDFKNLRLYANKFAGSNEIIITTIH